MCNECTANLTGLWRRQSSGGRWSMTSALAESSGRLGMAHSNAGKHCNTLHALFISLPTLPSILYTTTRVVVAKTYLVVSTSSPPSKCSTAKRNRMPKYVFYRYLRNLCIGYTNKHIADRPLRLKLQHHSRQTCSRSHRRVCQHNRRNAQHTNLLRRRRAPPPRSSTRHTRNSAPRSHKHTQLKYTCWRDHALGRSQVPCREASQ